MIDPSFCRSAQPNSGRQAPEEMTLPPQHPLRCLFVRQVSTHPGREGWPDRFQLEKSTGLGRLPRIPNLVGSHRCEPWVHVRGRLGFGKPTRDVTARLGECPRHSRDLTQAGSVASTGYIGPPRQSECRRELS